MADRSISDRFPDPARALDDPPGLLAAGGDLDTDTLLDAYRQGIFPWYSAPGPILWWCPDPRCVLPPGRMHVSRSLGRTLRRGAFQVGFDRAFARVLEHCAAPRAGQDGTWLGADMRSAYLRLHTLGVAHSVECWLAGELVGGVYGVAIGRAFFGESMFSRRDDASKVALAWLSANLARWGYEIFDCQVENPHLTSLGARRMPRRAFLEALARACAAVPSPDAWRQWSTPA
ncbi:MAG: leucyl/phenylalanyl-tRNA--protein transferase [Gammaproteobacteria bacterium]